MPETSPDSTARASSLQFASRAHRRKCDQHKREPHYQRDLVRFSKSEPPVCRRHPQRAWFHLEADAAAREWLDVHPGAGPRVIAYDIHRCCGGGKVCQVKVRGLSRKDDPGEYATGEMDDGTRFLIDRRAAARLPSRFKLTVRGLGPLRHLDLKGEQWGTLLYD